MGVERGAARKFCGRHDFRQHKLIRQARSGCHILLIKQCCLLLRWFACVHAGGVAGSAACMCGGLHVVVQAWRGGRTGARLAVQQRGLRRAADLVIPRDTSA